MTPPPRDLALQPNSGSVRVAREAVARFANEYGLVPSMIELLRIAVSELVTNALVHGAPPFRLEIDGDVATVRVTVSDASAREPQPTRAAITDPQGRGLTVLERIADDFGWYARGAEGKSVWFTVRRDRR